MTPPRTSLAVGNAIEQMLSLESPAVEWLRKAGPIARQLNKESKAEIDNEMGGGR